MRRNTASRSRNGFVDVVPAAATIGGLAALVLVLVVAGPDYWAVEFAFGSDYAVARRDMVLLTASSVGLMVVLSLAQGLIACQSRGRMALAWVAGMAVFPVVIALGNDLFLRVEVALISTVLVTAVVMAVFLVDQIRDKGSAPA